MTLPNLRDHVSPRFLDALAGDLRALDALEALEGPEGSEDAYAATYGLLNESPEDAPPFPYA